MFSSLLLFSDLQVGLDQLAVVELGGSLLARFWQAQVQADGGFGFVRIWRRVPGTELPPSAGDSGTRLILFVLPPALLWLGRRRCAAERGERDERDFSRVRHWTDSLRFSSSPNTRALVTVSFS